MFLRYPQISMALAIIVLASHGVRADKTQDARKAIQAAYDRNNAAMVRRDVSGVLATYAPGYTSIDQNGQETARSGEEERQHWVESLTPPSKVKSKTRIVDLKLQDGGAVVTTESHEDITYVSRKTKSVQRLNIIESARDFWVKSQNRWLWKRSRTLTISAAT